MRLYSFVNYYLSALQHGLQTAHCVSEMAIEVEPDSFQEGVFYDWAENHKTIIICNGGNVESLEDLYTRLINLCDEFALPVTKFYEDEQSLNEALTAVAVIVPEHFYDVKFVRGVNVPDSYERADGVQYFENTNPSEFTFISLLKSYRLA